MAKPIAGILLLICTAACNQGAGPLPTPPSAPSASVERSDAGRNRTGAANTDNRGTDEEVTVNQNSISNERDAVPNGDRKLDIVIVPSKTKEAGRHEVSIRVTNLSSQPVGWDKECSAFIVWNISNAEGTRIEPTEQPADRPGSLRERFFLLKPGETYAHSLDLTKGIRRFFHARAALASLTGESVVVPTAGEFLAAYELGKAGGKLGLSIEYDSSDDDARDGFAVYFGFRPETVGIDSLRARSNTFEMTSGN